MKKTFNCLAFVVAVLLSLTVLSQAAAQDISSPLVVTTDRTGYLAGEIITISGSGFGPNELVTVKIARTPEASASDPAPWEVWTDLTGAFTTTWCIDPSDPGGNAFLVTASAASGSAQTPFSRIAVVGADKYDYQPGETAVIIGAGFRPWEAVSIRVEHSNGLNDGVGHLPFDAFADADGRIIVTWLADPDDSEGSIFRLTATGTESGLVATSTFTDLLITIIDDLGPDDPTSGQQTDLSEMSIDAGASSIALTWQWDDTDFGNLGGNTGDACALIDTDGNGLADYSFCVRVDGKPAVQISNALYTCRNDSAFRCFDATPKSFTSATFSTASVVAGSDPFKNFPAHTDKKCDTDANCVTDDTVANVTLHLDDVGGSAARLVNVCSYPSGQPNSDYSDCVVVPNSGFLTIVKVATPNDGTTFTFTTSAPSRSGQTIWSINGSGTAAQSVSFAPGTGYNLNESVPAAWSLESASCVIQSIPTATTGTPDAPPPQTGPVDKGVQNLQIKTGLETICTFSDSKRPKLTVNKVLEPPSDPGKFNLQIDAVTKAANVGNGGTTGAVVVSVGAHTVGETAGTDTNLSDYVTTFGGDCATDGTINLAAGDNKVCTITNKRKATLTVNKVLQPAGDVGRFNLQIDGETKGTGANVGDGGTTGAVATGFGSHTVGETGANGTDLLNYETTIDGDCASDGTITLAAGDEKTCTITNKRKPKLTVTKVLVPAADGGKFNLQIDAVTKAADVGDTGTTGPVVVSIGNHTVGETAGTNTNLSNYLPVIGGACNADGTITLAAGDAKTCTITNTHQMVTPTITTTPNPSVAQFLTVLNDSATLSGGYGTPGGSITFNLYPPSDTTCAGTPAYTQTVTVTDNGTYNTSPGLAANLAGEWNWTADYLGDTWNNPASSGCGQEKVSVSKFNPQATFTTTTNPPDAFIGETLQDSATLAGSSCIARPPDVTFTLYKPKPSCYPIPENPTPEQLECACSSDVVAYTETVKSEDWDCNSNIWTASTVTGFTPTDPTTAGKWHWKASFPADINYEAGITKCEDEPVIVRKVASLTIVKDAVPDGDQVFNFTTTGTDLKPPGETVPVDFTLVDSANPSKLFDGLLIRVSASITAEETSVPSSWDLTNIQCTPPDGTSTYVYYAVGEDPTQLTDEQKLFAVGDTKVLVTLAEGEDVTCTFTDKKWPTLKLVKTVTNDNGGDKTAHDWTLTAAYNTPPFNDHDISTLGDEGVFEDVYAGKGYVLDESSSVTGYTAGSWNCDGGDLVDSAITLDYGDNVTCTIENDDVAPKLTLVKTVVNDNGGTKVVSDFPLFINLVAATSGTAYDQVANVLLTATETPQTGYAASVWGGDCAANGTITLLPGDNKTCTITNDDITAHLKLVKVVVGSADAATLWTLTATGTKTYSGPGGFDQDVDADAYTLSETSRTGFTASDWVCVGGTQSGSHITLGLEQSATCTITNTRDTGSLKIVKTLSKFGDPPVPSSFKIDYDCGIGAPSGSVDLAPGAFTVIDGIPTGSSCTVSEATLTPIPGYTWSPAVITPTPPVVILEKGVTYTVTVANLIMPAIAVTDSSLCTFDYDGNPANGRQFRRIFSQDVQNWPWYKLTATNPGQFFYNLSLVGTAAEKVKITLEVPWPFVTQGNMPVHVYDGVTVCTSDSPQGVCTDPVRFPNGILPGQSCFVPGNETDAIQKYIVINDTSNPDDPNVYDYQPIVGRTGYLPTHKTVMVELEITIPSTGFAYVNQHLDDGLKGKDVDVDEPPNGPERYGKVNGNATWPTTDTSDLAHYGKILIPNLANHEFHLFSGWGIDPLSPPPAIGGDAVQNENEFKKNPGVGGLVQLKTSAAPYPNPPGLTVTLWPPTGPSVGTAITDPDGWYMIPYKHTGKAATYRVSLPAPDGRCQLVTLKANAFAEASWVYGDPPPTPCP